MAHAAKAIIIDDQNKYLILTRSNHPLFGNDADLAGGTVEEGEDHLQAMLRELVEEIGLIVDPQAVKEIYSGSEYSRPGTTIALYEVSLTSRPKITLSWEHSAYEWVDKAEFLDRSKNAVDSYMHMVYAVLSKQTQIK